MKVSEYWSVHRELTGKSSEIVRTLVLSGAAIVWLFHGTDRGGIQLPTLTIWALALFSAAVLCDLLQYAWSGEMYRCIARGAEKRGNAQDAELPLHGALINAPTYVFYWLKIGLTIGGYALLMSFLAGELSR